MSTRLDAVMQSYVEQVDRLWLTGARQYVVLGIAQMHREPVWRTTKSQPLTDGTASNILAAEILPAVTYWNRELRVRLDTWRRDKTDVTIEFVDTMSAYARVLNNPRG